MQRPQVAHSVSASWQRHSTSASANGRVAPHGKAQRLGQRYCILIFSTLLPHHRSPVCELPGAAMYDVMRGWLTCACVLVLAVKHC